MRVVVCLPTGAGKTTIAAALLLGARAPLAIVHTTTLRDQTRRRLGAGVRVATIQGLLARGRRIDADVVFFDECHHLASASWHRVLALLPKGVRVVGMTATPVRADGTALGTCFDALVSTTSYSDLLARGWLAPCRVVDVSGIAPADAYLEHGQRRPGILFAPSIAGCNAAVATLLAAGVRAAAIDNTTPARMRAWAFQAYDSGELDLLASPMALSEGFDSPRAAVCILDRTCVHDGIYLQTAGRVLRPHPTKTASAPALLLDCRGAALRHGSPTDDRSYHLDGAPIRPASAPPAPRQHPASTPPAPRQRPASAPTVSAVQAAGRSLWTAVRALWAA
jgi:superfamily II DNA or RNA helicase